MTCKSGNAVCYRGVCQTRDNQCKAYYGKGERFIAIDVAVFKHLVWML